MFHPRRICLVFHFPGLSPLLYFSEREDDPGCVSHTLAFLEDHPSGLEYKANRKSHKYRSIMRCRCLQIVGETREGRCYPMVLSCAVVRVGRRVMVVVCAVCACLRRCLRVRTCVCARPCVSECACVFRRVCVRERGGVREREREGESKCEWTPHEKNKQEK